MQSTRNSQPHSVDDPGYKDKNNQIESDIRISHRFLEIANRHTEMTPLLNEFVSEIQKMTGCEAVGIRVLDENGNIPYQVYTGFSKKFYELESPLSINCDPCMCINVIKGTTDPNMPYYTSRGSFHTNGTTRLMATFSEAEKGPTRNACNRFGFESVALIPMRLGNRILGLIHLADSRENVISSQTVVLFEWMAGQMAMALQRIKTEASLKESEERLRKLGDNLPGGMIYRLVHRSDGSRSFTYASQGCERIFRMRLEDIAENADVIYQMIAPEELERVALAERESIENLNVFNIECPMTLPNGELHWFQWHSKPVRMSDGTLIWDGVCLDITRRKQAEEALLNARDALEHRVQERTAGLQKHILFEQLLTNLSARFIDPPPDAIDREIESGLKQILDLFGLDRCGLFKVISETKAVCLTHIALGKGVSPVPTGGDLMPHFPWILGRVISGEIVGVDAHDFPPEASKDRESSRGFLRFRYSLVIDDFSALWSFCAGFSIGQS